MDYINILNMIIENEDNETLLEIRDVITKELLEEIEGYDL